MQSPNNLTTPYLAKKVSKNMNYINFDFNNAEPQSFGLIPKGTIARVKMTIKPGGYNDHNMGWTGDYATNNPTSGAIYLSVEFVIAEGQYAKRKVWSLIGLHSPKGLQWANSGRSFIRAILSSSRGFSEKDNSPQAISARRIKSFAELDGIEFTARIDVEVNNDEERNVIKFAITKDHKDHAAASHLVDPPPYEAVPDWAR